MSKIEYAACRICNEYIEPSNLIELFDVFTEIVAQIKEVIGVELVNGPNLPSSICRKCNTDFETAQEFRRRCLESNEYFGLKCHQSPIKCEVFVKKEETPLTLEPKFENTSEYSEEEHVQTQNKDHTDNEISEQKQDDEEEEGFLANYKKPIKALSPRCRKKYKTREFNVNRKRKEKSNTPVICDICGNSFKAKHVFALHLRRHSNNKPYDCELCSSSFYTNSELKRHMRRHTGEKPYECQYCHRKFSDYGTHTKHERTHTNDRPFSCNQCGKSFSCNFVLKNHMLIHTGERAFKCDVCDKSFGRQHNLTTHMKSIYHQKNILKKTNGNKIG